MKKDINILVVLHLFYMDSWGRIKAYLNNLSRYKFDLIVSYTKGYEDKRVLEEIRESYPQVAFYEFENRGFDVGPFFECLQKVDLDVYDIVYKLHSKGINEKQRYCYHRLFLRDDWFVYLYEAILGKKNVYRVIKKLMDDNEIGLVAAKNLIIEDPPHKINLTKKWAMEMKYEIGDTYTYVAGTCFAVKAKVLKKIQKWNIGIDAFEEVRRGKFSYAHALERLICVNILEQGYTFYGIDACKIRRVLRKIQSFFVKKSNSHVLLKDKRVLIDDEFFYVFFEGKYIERYEIAQVRLKDIRREWKGKYYSLQECAPYKYLEGDTKLYNEYCKENSQKHPFDMSVDRFDKLINGYKNKEFDSKYLPIVNENNLVLDGQHRLCILLKEFGPEHEVNVLKVKCKCTIRINLDKKDIKTLRNFAVNNRIYIYGAGVYGERYLNELEKSNIPIEGFVVTNKQENKMYLGKKVLGIEEIKERNVGFVLALNERNKREVIKTLNEKRFDFYFSYE
ncbi:MAG: hypothetical protein IJZ82_08520 [Lachnospiraceae bacterium]|nr:hypothetical protein [Lachnospiraceae bacterium]